MRKAAFAEWLLSLVARPDRAASTVGDLLEEAPARGALWFWFTMLRTLCFLSVRGWPAKGLAGWLCAALLERLWEYSGFALLPRFYSTIELVMCTVAAFVVGWMLAIRSRGCAQAAVYSAVAVMVVWRSFVSSVSPGLAFIAMCVTALFVASGFLLSSRTAEEVTNA